jgi:hypothetical protein
MSVWPELCGSDSGALSGTEGELISATIAVEPQSLERLLEALAAVRFPVNPQIYHNAWVTYVYPNGSETAEPTTIVEFPAYRGRLDEVRNLLSQEGFDPASLWVKNLLDEIHSSFDAEPAPAGAPYAFAVRRKHGMRAS